MDIHLGMVAIIKANGEIAGAGFLVSPSGLILTCSHVVAKAGSGPGQSVAFRFLCNSQLGQARVAPEWWRERALGDISVLRFLGDAPVGALKLPLGSSEGTSGHPFSTLGFPSLGAFEGVPDQGTVVGVALEGGQKRLAVKASGVTAGFSGAPAWDNLRRRVIGVVSMIAKPDSFGRLSETAFVIPTEAFKEMCSALAPEDICPYRSLEPFEQHHADVFFGRESATDQVIAKLKEQPKFVALLGPSGSGKSSLVSAGVVPKLVKEVPQLGTSCEVIRVRPGNDPYHNLTISGFATSQAGLSDLIQEWRRRRSADAGLALIFDQFEDLFVNCSDEVARRFISEMIEALEHSEDRTLILIVMRDDFYWRLIETGPRITGWLEKGLKNIPLALTKADLADIIERPARESGWVFDPPDVPDQIILQAIEHFPHQKSNDAAVNATALPVIELCLTELWHRRRDGAITSEGLVGLGGLAGCINSWADRMYFSLSEEDRSLAKSVLVELVYVVDEAQALRDVRRRRFPEELCIHQDRGKVEKVVQQLANARLVVTSDGCVELIHDVLVLKWGLLQEWLKAERRFRLWHQEIDPKFNVWKRSCPGHVEKRDPGELLLGRDLERAERWYNEREPFLGEELRVFIRTSIEAEEQRQLEEELRRERELELQRKIAEEARERAEETSRSARRLRKLVRYLSVAILVSCGLIVVASIALEARKAAQKSAEEKLYYSNVLLANDLLRSGQFELARTTLQESPHDLRNWEWRFLVNEATHRAFFIRAKEEIKAAAVSDHGAFVAVADGGLEIRHVTDGSLITNIVLAGAGTNSVPEAIQFGPDDTLVVTYSEQGVVRVLRPPTFEDAFAPWQGRAPLKTVLTRDGNHLGIITRCGTLHSVLSWKEETPEDKSPSSFVLLDLKTGRKEDEFQLDGGSPAVLDFNPKTNEVAFGTTSGGIFIVDLSKHKVRSTAAQPQWRATVMKGTPTYQLRGYFFDDFQFSSTGQFLFSRFGDTQCWETSETNAPVLYQNDEMPTAAAFLDDESTLVTGNRDGTVDLWSPKNNTNSVTEHLDTKPIRLIKADRSSKVAAAVTEDGRALLWHIKSGFLYPSLPLPDQCSAVAFAKGNSDILAWGKRFVSLWKHQSASMQLLSGESVSTEPDQVVDVEASTVTNEVLTLLGSGQLDLWRTESGEHVQSWDVGAHLKDEGMSVESKDAIQVQFLKRSGRLLIVPRHDEVTIWDPANGQVTKPFGDAHKITEEQKENSLFFADSDVVWVEVAADEDHFLATVAKEETITAEYWSAKSKQLIASFDLKPESGALLWKPELNASGDQAIFCLSSNIAALVELPSATNVTRCSQKEQLIIAAHFDILGTRFFTASAWGDITVWSATNGAVLQNLRVEGKLVRDARFSNDGKKLFLVAQENPTGTHNLNFRISPVEDDPDRPLPIGRIVCLDTERNRSMVLGPYDDVIECWTPSPDGTRVAIVGDDHAVSLWDTRTGRPVLKLAPLRGRINKIAFSQDGSLLMAACKDGSANVWNGN